MADIELVIKIPEEEYRWIIKSDETIFADVVSKEGMLHAIKNGTPLPKHHGRIIDESKIKNIMCYTEQELYGNEIRYVKTTDAPTIIEGSDNNDT